MLNQARTHSKNENEKNTPHEGSRQQKETLAKDFLDRYDSIFLINIDEMTTSLNATKNRAHYLPECADVLKST